MEKTNNPVAVEGRLYRWVKANERSPNTFLQKYVTRYYNIPDEFKILTALEIDEQVNAEYVIEWLEEIPIKEHLPVEDGKDKLIKELQDQSTLLYQENVKLLQAVKSLEPVVEDGKIQKAIEFVNDKLDNDYLKEWYATAYKEIKQFLQSL